MSTPFPIFNSIFPEFSEENQGTPENTQPALISGSTGVKTQILHVKKEIEMLCPGGCGGWNGRTCTGRCRIPKNP